MLIIVLTVLASPIFSDGQFLCNGDILCDREFLCPEVYVDVM